MKQTKETPATPSPSKRYVSYGINGMYYVYDNEENQIPMGYGTGNSSRRMIKRKCEQLNHELLTTPSPSEPDEFTKENFESFLDEMAREHLKTDEEYDDYQGLFWKDKIRFLIGS